MLDFVVRSPHLLAVESVCVSNSFAKALMRAFQPVMVLANDVTACRGSL